MHKEQVKPNFHWITHLFDQIEDYGPVHGYWAFPYERLNKVLKSFKTNNHARGEIEVTYMREFAREGKLRQLLKTAISQDGALVSRVAKECIASQNDSRGSLASLTRELEEVDNNCKSLSPSLFIINLINS